jgi:hypothetical protein
MRMADSSSTLFLFRQRTALVIADDAGTANALFHITKM